MRTVFSIQWLLTTLGMLEAQRSAQEVMQQQHLATHDGLPLKAIHSSQFSKEKTYEAHKAKAAKTDE